MYNDDRGLLQGTLELLILKTLTWGSAHGYGIASWIERITGDALRVEEGSLYPALHRMERKGLIESVWGLSENNRKAKFYSLTAAGRTHLTDKVAGWDRLVSVVDQALRNTDAPSWAGNA
jgi:PadR family transcriptional regulator, regulatory protein PadR